MATEIVKKQFSDGADGRNEIVEFITSAWAWDSVDTTTTDGAAIFRKGKVYLKIVTYNSYNYVYIGNEHYEMCPYYSYQSNHDMSHARFVITDSIFAVAYSSIGTEATSTAQTIVAITKGQNAVDSTEDWGIAWYMAINAYSEMKVSYLGSESKTCAERRYPKTLVESKFTETNCFTDPQNTVYTCNNIRLAVAWELSNNARMGRVTYNGKPYYCLWCVLIPIDE